MRDARVVVVVVVAIVIKEAAREGDYDYDPQCVSPGERCEDKERRR